MQKKIINVQIDQKSVLAWNQHSASMICLVFALITFYIKTLQQNFFSEQRTKSPLASEEDLDSVINLLSGFIGPAHHMQPIPEDHTRLRVPPVFSSRTPSPRESDENMRMAQGRHQRHSDGAIDLTGVGHIRGNTWPHRSSLPTGFLNAPMNYPDYCSANSTLPRRYSSEFGASAQPGYHGGLTAGNYNMGYRYGIQEGRHNTSRTWPFVPLSSQG